MFLFFHWKVDSANSHGILLQVVQVLTDLNLIITKAYICSDGGWVMDGTAMNLLKSQNRGYAVCPLFNLSNSGTHSLSVFNVTDNDGNKIRDEGILDYLQKVKCFSPATLHL